MKKLFLALALSAAACLAGCSDNEEIGYDIGSKVLSPKNGLQQVALTADAAAVDYEVWIYRSGYNEGGSTAALSVDAEALAAFNKAGLNFAFPTRTLLVQRGGEDAGSRDESVPGNAPQTPNS